MSEEPAPKVPMSCACGSRLFRSATVFQTFDDGRTFELASAAGTVKNIWALECLRCRTGYVMGSKPVKQGGLHMLGTTGADALLEEFSTDGVFTHEDSIPVHEA